MDESIVLFPDTNKAEKNVKFPEYVVTNFGQNLTNFKKF